MGRRRGSLNKKKVSFEIPQCSEKSVLMKIKMFDNFRRMNEKLQDFLSCDQHTMDPIEFNEKLSEAISILQQIKDGFRED